MEYLKYMQIFKNKDLFNIRSFIILFAIKIVAKRYLGKLKCVIIILSCFFFDFFSSDKSEGSREKKATSEADTNPDDIISINQKIIKK